MVVDEEKAVRGKKKRAAAKVKSGPNKKQATGSTKEDVPSGSKAAAPHPASDTTTPKSSAAVPSAAAPLPEGGKKESELLQEEEEKTARQLFDLLKAEHDNTAAFAAVLLQDRSLQRDLRIIVDVTTPLHNEYQDYLKVHKDGPAALLQASAQRSLGKWFRTVAETLRTLESSRLITRLELTPVTVSNSVLRLDDGSVAEDVRVTRALFDSYAQTEHGRRRITPWFFPLPSQQQQRARRTRPELAVICGSWQLRG